MKLTRSEFQNYIHSYEQDEIFYRDLYLAEKEHPETFREYCQNLDREMIAQRQALCSCPSQGRVAPLSE